MDRKKALIVFGIIALAFLVFELASFSYTIGDENNYYYMAKAVSQGQIPYKDFFFAHPPLQLIPLALFSFFGIFAMKFTAVLFALATGYLVFLILLEKGPKEAIVGSILFFTSHEILLHGANPVGQDITAFFLALGLYFYFKKSNLFAGLAFGLASLSGLYALVPICVLFLFEMFKKDRKQFVETTKGFFISFGIGNLILIIFLWKDYVIPVYLFQLIRPSVGSNLLVALDFVKFNLLLVLGFALYFFHKEKKKAIIAAVLVYFVYLAISSSIFLHYYFLLVPMMAIAGGYSITATLNKDKRLVYVFAIIVLIVGAFAAINVNNTNKATRFDAAKEIADEIGQGKTLFGTDASLVALLSNGNIPTQYIDANLQRYRSGLANVNDTIRILNESHAYVITGEIYTEQGRIKRGLLYYDEYDSFLKNSCRKIDRNFDGYHWVYRC